MAGLISNGSYVLENPNTRDLYLGKGLKDGFEGDKYYIAADETVLWEGSPSSSSEKLIMSESWNNFERIRVLFKAWARRYYIELSSSSVLHIGEIFQSDATRVQIIAVAYSNNTDKTEFTWLGTSNIYLNGYSATDFNSNIVPIEIVGINRKRG